MSFGRRASAASTRPPMPAVTKIARAQVPVQTGPKIEPSTPSVDSVDEELRQWKKSRRFVFPIRSLALMASLSFGIASLVLPADINEQVQYPLYALSAASLFAGLRRKRQA